MKFIPQIYLRGQGEKAIALYKEAFHLTVKTLIHYKDAVQSGWEPPNEAINPLIYHSELIRDGFELKVTDLGSREQAEKTRLSIFPVQFETEEEVRSAFRILSANGIVLRALTKPPHMVIIGEVRDPFGVHWILMCDFR